MFQSLEKRVLLSKGDNDLIERLIVEQLIFIKKIVKAHVWQYRSQEDDDLVVAMLAFQEAVQNYSEEKGKFLGFAKVVITRRLIDQFRKRQKHEDALKYSLDQQMEDEEGSSYNKYELSASLDQHQKVSERNDMKTEIEQYKRDLLVYDITMEDLVENAPKSEDNKTLFIQIGKYLYIEIDLRKLVVETRRLPMKSIEEAYDIQRKKLERGRKYILGVFVLYLGEYELLMPFLERR